MGRPRTNTGFGVTGQVSELQEEFILWMLTPVSERQPATQREWAKQHGTWSQTITAWKSKDPWFRNELMEQMRLHNINPDRLQVVIDALFISASNPENRGQVSAAKLLLEYLELFMPTRKSVTEHTTKIDASELSDDELKALIAEQAQKELVARREG